MIGTLIVLAAFAILFGKWALAPVYLPPPQPADSPRERARGWRMIAAHWDADDDRGGYRGRHWAAGTA